MAGRAGRPKCNFGAHASLMYDMYKDFTNDPVVKKEILDPDEAFGNLVYNEFKMPLEIFTLKPKVGKGELKGLKTRLDNLKNAVQSGQLSGKFASLFYTPSAISAKDPVLGKLLDRYIEVSNNHKKSDTDHNRLFKEIDDSLKDEMRIRGLISGGMAKFGKAFTRTSAQAELNRVEEEIKSLLPLFKKGDASAQNQIEALVDQKHKLLTETELQVNTQFIGYIENGLPKLIDDKIQQSIEANKIDPKNKILEYKIKFDKRPDKPFLDKSEIAKLTDKEGNRISGKMVNSLHKYMKLMDEMHFNLGKGVEAYIDSMIKGKQGDVKAYKDLKKSLMDKLMPNREKGFYPHFSTELNVDFMDGLMPKLEDLVLTSNDYFKGDISAKQAMENINGYISGHTKSRNPNADVADFSLNFTNVVSGYINNVDRFNYINYINNTTKDALLQVESMYKSGRYQSGYGQSIVEFVQDLHKSATGFDAVKNPQLNAFMRSMLGLEFISKIGFNPRSAVRNVSQSLLNIVEFGPIAMRQSDKFFEANPLDLNKVMAESGLLYKEGGAELEEAIGSHNPGNNGSFRWNESMKEYEYIPISKMEKIATGVSYVSSKAGYMMAAVENFNRKQTFKIGYSQMYKQLEHPGFIDYVKNQYRSRSSYKKDPADWDSLIESKKQEAAKKYAMNMVVALHFDYSAFSKAKALRGTTGKVLGQFQHYAFKFAEYNMDLLRKAKNDVFAGEFNGDNAWKAYRLGMVYFLAPTIASTVTGVNFGNLVEHDTSDRIEKLWAGLAGDEDDRKRAFYGKGPVIGSIGAPIVSDLLNIGMMYEFINLDDDDFLSWGAGIQELDKMDGDRRLYQTARLFNTAIPRIAFRTVPQLAKGNIGWAIQSELGLYPDKKAKEYRLALDKLSPSTVEILESLEELEQFGR
tara:strand:- start:1081 stop:3828 length:2748 start_codon:yes stop_codon:yes gene_type:complete